jgi:pilus assembly protein CpaB
MATRFGGASPTYAYTIKVRYIVGLLILIIIILAFTLLLLLNEQPGETPNAAVPTEGTFAAANTGPKPPGLDVIVAQSRIEEGQRLEKHMFSSMSWDPDRLPEGAFLWREVDAVAAGNKFSKAMIPANSPITRDVVSDVQPTTALKIPPGFRAVTILVDARTGVEGWAKPDSRVDVLCTYTDRKDGLIKVLTVVRFVKILSVGGAPSAEQKAAVSSGQTTVTLLVAEQDSRKVELARSIGQLTLSLVGDVEPERTQIDTGPIDVRKLLSGGEIETPAEVPPDGTMMMTDPKTQRPVRMILRNGRWEKDASSE